MRRKAKLLALLVLAAGCRHAAPVSYHTIIIAPGICPAEAAEIDVYRCGKGYRCTCIDGRRRMTAPVQCAPGMMPFDDAGPCEMAAVIGLRRGF